MSTAWARHAQKTGRVLILGNFRPALAIARSLRQAGYRIIVNSEGPEPFAHHSRHVDGMWRHPPLARGRREFLGALDAYLRAQPDMRFVFPVLDGFVNLLADESRLVPEDRGADVPRQGPEPAARPGARRADPAVRHRAAA